MGSAPPWALEFIVALFTPPACREHVLGDLQERYQSPPQYFAEASSAVPLVILSRIRRTTDIQVLLIEALIVYTSFLAIALYVGERAFLYQDAGLLRLAVPTLVAVIALVTANAYANPARPSPIKPVLQSAFALAVALLGQAWIFDSNRHLALPMKILLYGSFFSFLLLSGFRMLWNSQTSFRR